MCHACRGELGYYDPETGIWLTCLNCRRGRALAARDEKNKKEIAAICEEKLRALQQDLERRRSKACTTADLVSVTIEGKKYTGVMCAYHESHIVVEIHTLQRVDFRHFEVPHGNWGLLW